MNCAQIKFEKYERERLYEIYGTVEKFDERFPELKYKWTVYRGGDVSRYVVTDCRITSAPDENAIPDFSNIGAFHITEDTRKYSANLFESLLCTWPAIFPDKFQARKINTQPTRKYAGDFFSARVKYISS